MDTIPAPARRGRPPKAEGLDTRQCILDAALDLFAREGYAGASIRQIARAVGITEAGLYAHFPSKRALSDTHLSSGGPTVVIGVLDAGDAGDETLDDPATFLRGLALRAVDAWDDPHARRLLSLLIREGAQGAAGDTSLVAAIARGLGRLAPLVARWVAAGRIRPIAAPEHLVWELFGPLNVIRILYLHAAATDAERWEGRILAERHIDFFLDAVLTT